MTDDAPTPEEAPARRRRGPGVLGWFLRAFGVLIVLLLVAGVALAVFFPSERVRNEVERQVELATGRDMAIGPVSFTFWPSIGIAAENVSLANPNGFPTTQPFVSARRVVFAVAVLPLLRRSIEVRRLYIEEPSLQLIAHADNHGNWEFATAQQQQGELDALRIDDVQIVNGRLSFQGPEGPPMVFDTINTRLAVQSLDRPIDVRGAVSYMGQPLNVSATISDPRAMLRQGTTPISVDVQSEMVNGTLRGVADTRTGRIAGPLEARGSSLRRVIDWLGEPLGPGPGFGAFEARGQMAYADNVLRLNDATLRLDAINATGDVTVQPAPRARLLFGGQLSTAAINLNAYMAPPAAGAAQGVEVDAAWPTTPIDLTGLAGADVQMSLTIGQLQFERMSMQTVSMTLGITDGVADARLTRLTLYGGSGTARVVADGRSANARIAQEFNVQNVQVLPFLRDSIGLDRIEGRGQVRSSLTGQGRTQAEIMRSLRGQVRIQVNDGAWRGVNLAQVGRQIQAALTRQAVGPSASTDFAELTATFNVANGVAATEDMHLLNPYVRLDGRGLINIGQQNLDMRIAPRAVSSGQGQGGAAGIAGLGIPFRVHGPWARVQYEIDLLDSGRQRLQDQLRNAAGGSNLGDIGSLFGLTPSSAPASTTPAAPGSGGTTTTPAAPSTTTTTPAPAQTPEQRARDALGGLLRRN